MNVLSKTTHFEGWEAQAQGPGVHLTHLAQEAASAIEATLMRGTAPGLATWTPNQRYELVVTLREVPAVQAGSNVPGAGKRSGKTSTVWPLLGREPPADHEIEQYHPAMGPWKQGMECAKPKCECGADATGGGGHSKWCPMAT